jgi:dinuclear metal center YbgI/SA1388 family protein
VKISDIYLLLDEISPFELQESWDNSGLIVGSMDDEFTKIYLSLDLDSLTIKHLEHNSLIILHHPLIFNGLKRLDSSIYPAKLIHSLIKKDIKVIAMHTNFDKTHMNRYIVDEILGYEVVECKNYECYFNVNKDFNTFVNHISNRLGINNIRVVKTKEFISSAALCSGSGGDLYRDLNKVDCFLTGDIKYHLAVNAKEDGVSLIDINHYESETVFSNALAKELKSKGIDAIIQKFLNPFEYFKGNV